MRPKVYLIAVFVFFLARQLYSAAFQLLCFSEALPIIKKFFSTCSKATDASLPDAPYLSERGFV